MGDGIGGPSVPRSPPSPRGSGGRCSEPVHGDVRGGARGVGGHGLRRRPRPPVVPRRPTRGRVPGVHPRPSDWRVSHTRPSAPLNYHRHRLEVWRKPSDREGGGQGPWDLCGIVMLQNLCLPRRRHSSRPSSVREPLRHRFPEHSTALRCGTTCTCALKRRCTHMRLCAHSHLGS